MSANYLHGVETIENRSGTRPVQVVKSAVVFLVSVAPDGDTQTLILVQSERDAAQFGVAHRHNYMRNAITAILAQGAGTILCVNVQNEDHLITITNEAHTVSGGRFKLFNLLVGAGDLEIKTTGGSPTTLVLDTDYSYDPATQVVTILNTTTYPDGTTLNADYIALTSTLTDIAEADIIGTTTSGTRTGLQLVEECFSTFGFNPRLFISTYFSHRAAVAAELIEKATAYRGHALLDAVAGVTPAQCISGRGTTAGTVKNFYTSSRHAILCYPNIYVANPYNSDADEDTEIMMPLSAAAAGVVCATDLNEGYWVSPSNHEIAGVLRMERVLTWALNRADTDVNLLNEKGIVTIAAGFGTGFRLWGNRSALFPSDTFPDNFIPVYRTGSVINESLELAMMPFVDKPINKGIIDAIVETGNAFMRTLIGRGAIVDGFCFYDPALNPPSELALGHLTISVEFMPPPPAERITFNSFINQALLAALNAA